MRRKEERKKERKKIKKKGIHRTTNKFKKQKGEKDSQHQVKQERNGNRLHSPKGKRKGREGNLPTSGWSMDILEMVSWGLRSFGFGISGFRVRYVHTYGERDRCGVVLYGLCMPVAPATVTATVF